MTTPSRPSSPSSRPFSSLGTVLLLVVHVPACASEGVVAGARTDGDATVVPAADAGSGPLPCADIHNCLAECEASDPSCPSDCRSRGSMEGLALLQALYECVEAKCSGAAGRAFQECVEARCGPEFEVCRHHHDPRRCGAFAGCASARCGPGDAECHLECFRASPASCQECIRRAEGQCIERTCRTEMRAVELCAGDFGCTDWSCAETRCRPETGALEECYERLAPSECGDLYDPCF